MAYTNTADKTSAGREVGARECRSAASARAASSQPQQQQRARHQCARPLLLPESGRRPTVSVGAPRPHSGALFRCSPAPAVQGQGPGRGGESCGSLSGASRAPGRWRWGELGPPGNWEIARLKPEQRVARACEGPGSTMLGRSGTIAVALFVAAGRAWLRGPPARARSCRRRGLEATAVRVAPSSSASASRHSTIMTCSSQPGCSLSSAGPSYPLARCARPFAATPAMCDLFQASGARLAVVSTRMPTTNRRTLAASRSSWPRARCPA